jgi:serine protease Do
MTQTTDYSTQSSFPLPDVFSAALTEIFDAVQPSIVQVRTEGRGAGTGTMWYEDGRIITNNHVVPDDRATIEVLLFDGRTLNAKVLDRNPRLDLAILKVNADNLKSLSTSDSSRLRIGEWVFAIGHPWGQRWVVTAGVVSSISSVKLSENLTTQYIKSDVRLAPGNSGGPLLDADGKVVGINAMIFGGDLSVAIPSNVVNAWMAGLPKQRLSLGVEVQTVELPVHIEKSLDPQRETGVLIVGIKAERQEKHNDILIGDILLDVAGEPVKDTAALLHTLAQKQDNAAIPMHILRGGAVVKVDIVPLVSERNT